MKNLHLALFGWLASTLLAAAQPNTWGPPSITKNYGLNPSSPANAFQDRPQQQLPAPTTTTSGNITGNTTRPLSPGSIPLGAPANTRTTSAPGASPGPDAGAPTLPGGLYPSAAGGNLMPAEGTGPMPPPTYYMSPVSRGPDLSNVTMPSSMETIDNQLHLAPRDQFVYQVTEDRDPPQVLFVDETGNIDVPYFGAFKAGNLTLREMATALKVELEKTLYIKATVLAALYRGEHSRGQVNVLGQVAHQGPIEVPANTVLTLWAAISAAGSFTMQADMERVAIAHHDQADPAKDTKQEVNVAELLNTGKVNDIIVQPGDFITVPAKGDASGYVTITGEVSRPQMLAVPAGASMKLSQAIMQAGWTDWSSHTVKLIHYDKDNTRHVQDVDMDLFFEKGLKEKDVPLTPGDQIIVYKKFWSFG